LYIAKKEGHVFKLVFLARKGKAQGERDLLDYNSKTSSTPYADRRIEDRERRELVEL